MRLFSRATWLAWAVACAMVTLPVADVEARTVTLQMKDGRQITGDLVSENDEAINLLISGIATRIARDDIKSLTIQKTIQEEYDERRAALKDDDVDGRYQLASWLYYDKKSYALARKELADLAKKFPNDSRVSLLLKVVEDKLALHAEPPPPPRTPAPPQTQPSLPKPPVGAPPVPGEPVKFEIPTRMLTPEQINVLKVYEVNLSERPTVVFERKELEAFLLRYVDEADMPRTPDERRAWINRLKPWEQLGEMFRVRARDFYPKAKIVGDPAIFAQFKDIHRRYISNRCASDRCHGGEDAKDIFLFNPARGQPDATNYTNFYILDQYEQPIKGVRRAMIDRVQPEQSLLLHHGLIKSETQTPHPELPGYMPPFRSRDDPMYATILGWIRSLLAPKPTYGIDYEIPRPPSSRPALDEAPATPGEGAPAAAAAQTTETPAEVAVPLRP